MFDFFRKKPPPSPGGGTTPTNPAAEAMRRAIAEKKKTDPMIGVKIGANEVLKRLLAVMKDEHGVHIESCLAVLGAMAGYACQHSVREEFVRSGDMPETRAFVVVDAKDGKRYFFGDLVNKPLAESRFSVWSLTAGAAQKMGLPVPDVNEIFKHVSDTVGTDSFGVPRVPEAHRARNLPAKYLKDLWLAVHAHALEYCNYPFELPVVFGLAIQEAIVMGKQVLDPTLAVAIVMESAIPMSKVDLRALT
ncbi:MAG: hypothetical protein EXR27_11435 [Betaproteobacteria bacterium]|nr:hypothetical protein [Betaproteobacteria bacterium]